MSRRVLVISETFYPEGGGSELATYTILRLLSKKMEFTVVTSTQKPAPIPGVDFIYVPALRYGNRIEKFIKAYTVMRSLEKLIRSHEILYIPRLFYMIIPIAKKKGLKTIVHLHDYALVHPSAVFLLEWNYKNKLMQTIIYEKNVHKSWVRAIFAPLSYFLFEVEKENTVSKIDRLICVSKRQAEIVSQLAPEVKDKIEVIYNPIPPELLNEASMFRKEPSETPTFLYVGGDSYTKGFDILLQAVRILDKTGVKAKLILTNKYGDKAMDRIQSLKQKLEHVSIEVVGRIEYSKLVEMHRHSWALLFPSIWEEPLPYAVVEAMVLGTIPVASRVGGVPEIVEGTIASRYLFSPWNVNEFYKRLYDVVLLSTSDIEKSTLLRDSARARFSTEDIVTRLIKIFAI